MGDGGAVPLLFNEELGLAMEVADEHVETVMAALVGAKQVCVCERERGREKRGARGGR